MQNKGETERALDIYRKYQEFFIEAAFEQVKFQKWLNDRVQRHQSSGNAQLIRSDEKITAVLGGITFLLQALSEQMGTLQYPVNIERYKAALQELQTNPNVLRAFLSQTIFNTMPLRDKSGISGQEDFFRDLTKLTGIQYSEDIKIAEYIVQNEETINDAAAAWYKSQGPKMVNLYHNRDYLSSYLIKAEKKGLYLSKSLIDRLQSLDLTLATKSFKETVEKMVEQSQIKAVPKAEETKATDSKPRKHYDEIPVSKESKESKKDYDDIPIFKGTKESKKEYDDIPVFTETKESGGKKEYGDLPVFKGPLSDKGKEEEKASPSIKKGSSYGEILIQKEKDELKQKPEATPKKSIYGGLPIYTGEEGSQKKQETKTSSHGVQPTSETKSPQKAPLVAPSDIAKEVETICSKLNKMSSSLPKEHGKKTATVLLTKTLIAIRWKPAQSPSYLNDVKQELISMYDEIMLKQVGMSAQVFSPVLAFINESLLAIKKIEGPVEPNDYTGSKKEFLKELINVLKETAKDDQRIPQLYKLIDLVKNTEKFDQHSLSPLKKELMTLQKMSKPGYLERKTEIQNTVDSILKEIEKIELSESKQLKK